jgi:hypothetical protein
MSTRRITVEDDPKKLRKQLRDRTKALKSLTQWVAAFIAILDDEMKKPSTPDRGSRLGKMAHAMQFINDSVRHFELSEKFPLKQVKGEALQAARKQLEEYSDRVAGTKY